MKAVNRAVPGPQAAAAGNLSGERRTCLQYKLYHWS